MASRVQRFIFPALLGILALLALGGGLWWWLEGRHWQSTDNAYVEADIATIAAKVPGYIASVPVSDNQPVKKGDALATIVDAEYRAALAGAEAEVERQRRARGSASAEVSVKTSSVAQSEAALAAAEANARRAAADAARAEGLLAQGWVTRATVDARRAEAESSSALVAERRAAIGSARAQREVATGDAGGAGASLRAALAVRDAAALDLENTVIRAPVDGIVGNRTARPGQYARAGQQLLVVVPSADAYVIANFKETQLAGMRPGMPVSITLDAYPELVLAGRIDSFSPASGSRFSIIPPENATGNFTRIVQRVPVKIVLERPLPQGLTLTPGLSASIDADLRQADARAR